MKPVEDEEVIALQDHFKGNVVLSPTAHMQVSDSLSAARSVLSAKSEQITSNIETEVARKALDRQKTEGAQLIDMIQKAGPVIDVMAQPRRNSGPAHLSAQ